jgi:hypothetical protein
MSGTIPQLPNTPLWRGAQLKHRDNFTFTFTFYSTLLTELIQRRQIKQETSSFYTCILAKVPDDKNVPLSTSGGSAGNRSLNPVRVEKIEAFPTDTPTRSLETSLPAPSRRTDDVSMTRSPPFDTACSDCSTSTVSVPCDLNPSLVLMFT